MKTLKQKYREKFHEWVTSSSSHGLPNLFRSSNVLVRIMWTIVFLGSFGYCTYTIVKSLIDFTQYETTVSIKKVQELPQVFPAVTVCNINPYNENTTTEYLNLAANSINNVSCLNYFNQSILCKRENQTLSSYCRDVEVNLQMCKSSSSFVVEDVWLSMANFIAAGFIDINEVGYTKDDLFKYCYFNNVLCAGDLWQQRWTNKFGFCYTFNGGNDNRTLMRTSEKGKDYGLLLELAVKTPFESEYFKLSKGIYLSVHNQSDSIYTLPFNGIILPPKSNIYVGIDRVFNYKLSSPYSDCIDELQSKNAYAQRLFKFFEYLNINYYDQDICFNLCYQDNLINECGCSNLRLPAIRNTSYCSKLEESDCMYEFDLKYYEADTNVYCKNACAQECTTIEYNYNTEYSAYASDGRVNSLISNFYWNLNYGDVDAFAKENIMKVTINYANKYYTAITDNPTYTPESLLGSIGGQLGLFIGISLLSIIEILELLIDLICIFFKHVNSK